MVGVVSRYTVMRARFWQAMRPELDRLYRRARLRFLVNPRGESLWDEVL